MKRNKPDLIIDEINLFIIILLCTSIIQYRIIKIKNNERNKKNYSDPKHKKILFIERKMIK